MRFLYRGSEFKPRKFHSESDYEAFLVPRLAELLPEYHILPFKLDVFADHNYGNRRADLVLIEKEYRNWIVVEVELGHHSLNSHVFPQAYTFRNGEYGQRHVNYLIRKLPELDPDKIEFLITYNPPGVLTIVDDEGVFERGWDSLRDVCEIGVAIPYRNRDNDYSLYYTGWLPKGQIEETTGTWKSAFGYLDVLNPSIIMGVGEEEVSILVNDRESSWKVRTLRDGIVFFPLDSWVTDFLTPDTEYAMKVVDDLITLFS